MRLRSVSFDTSFLLNYSSTVDDVVKLLSNDQVPCFLTSTVMSELEQLKTWNRISNYEYKYAIKRLKRANVAVIDFKNQFLSSVFGKKCMQSMEKHHGVKPKDIVNDCHILVSILKNGVDLFLSEDYHFTSKITSKVVDEIKNAACKEYNQLCKSEMYSIDSKTFLKAYKHGNIDLDIVKSRIRNIRKNGKRLVEK